MARKARNSRRSTSRRGKSRSASKSRRSTSRRSKSTSGRYLRKSQAQKAMTTWYKNARKSGQFKSAKAMRRSMAYDKSHTGPGPVTRTRRYLKDPHYYDYPGVDTKGSNKVSKSRSKSHSKSRSKSRRSLKKNVMRGPRKLPRNCWGDFTIGELKLITKDLVAQGAELRMHSDRNKLCRQLNKHFGIEEAIERQESIVKAEAEEKRALAKAEKLAKARAAVEKKLLKEQEKVDRELAKLRTGPTRRSYGPRTERDTEAIRDFIRAYAAKPYKTQAARLSAMTKDLNSTKNVTTDYGTWKSDPSSYDLEGVDTRDSDDSFLNEFRGKSGYEGYEFAPPRPAPYTAGAAPTALGDFVSSLSEDAVTERRRPALEFLSGEEMV